MQATSSSPPPLHLPSVHTNGLTVENPHIDGWSQAWLFKGREHHRDAHLFALQHVETKETTRRRGIDCGSHIWLAYSEFRDAYALRRDYCGHRLCPACGPLFSQRRSETLLRKLPWRVKKNDFKFITLTLTSNDDPLGKQLADLTRAFRRLRQTGIWNKTVLYGAAQIEVTINPETLQWHPHVHIVARAHFIPWAELKEAWIKASRGSSIVHVVAARSKSGVISYVTKYATKSFDLANILRVPSAYLHLYEAFKRRRQFITFGTWPEAPKRKSKTDVVPNDWKFVAYVDDLLNRPRLNGAFDHHVLERFRSQRIITRTELYLEFDAHHGNARPPPGDPFASPRSPEPVVAVDSLSDS